jgi:hypothetical protein
MSKQRKAVGGNKKRGSDGSARGRLLLAGLAEWCETVQPKSLEDAIRKLRWVSKAIRTDLDALKG